MKMTIEFQLPEERQQFMQTAHAEEAWALMAEIEHHLRQVIKHGEGGYKTPEELATAIRFQLNELLAKAE